MSTKRKSRINKTIGYASEIVNRELLLPADEDDDFDDVEDFDCFDQPVCFDIDSVNRLLAEAAYASHASDAELEDDEKFGLTQAELTWVERDPN